MAKKDTLESLDAKFDVEKESFFSCLLPRTASPSPSETWQLGE